MQQPLKRNLENKPEAGKKRSFKKLIDHIRAKGSSFSNITTMVIHTN
jgi:hypothetical protein